MTEKIKTIADAVSIATVGGTLAGWLPAVAAFFAMVYTIIRIFETRTVRGWLKRK